LTNNLIIKCSSSGLVKYTKESAIEQKVVNKYSYSLDIIAGEYAIVSDDSGVIMQTILGSCISIVVYDVKLQITGFNHYLIPIGNGLKSGKESTEELLKQMYKLGSNKKDLLIKIYGGASLSSLGMNSINIGQKNTNFAKDFCDLNKFKVRQMEVGGSYGRILQIKPFFITTSKNIK